MSPSNAIPYLSEKELLHAASLESKEFIQSYRWLEAHMPPSFLSEIGLKERLVVARNLMSFSLQEHYEQVRLKHISIAMCLDGPDADLRILKKHTHHVIRYYRAFVSNAPPLDTKRENYGLLLSTFGRPCPKNLYRKSSKQI